MMGAGRFRSPARQAMLGVLIWLAAIVVGAV
jgi:hypothetical protein